MPGLDQRARKARVAPRAARPDVRAGAAPQPAITVRPLVQADLRHVVRIDAGHRGSAQPAYWKRVFTEFLGARRHHGRVGVAADVDGRLAAAGAPDRAVLAELLADPFFDAEPPKSTGRERFGRGYSAALFRRVGGANAVATAVELTAMSVARAINRWMPQATEVVGSGGGCHHPGVMAALAGHLGTGIRLARFDDLFFSGDAKEAVAFALLGYLSVHGQPGNLPAVTGAKGSRVLGMITPA